MHTRLKFKMQSSRILVVSAPLAALLAIVSLYVLVLAPMQACMRMHAGRSACLLAQFPMLINRR